MKINWCVISFKFNFLAEAVFKTLPENTHGEIFLIHVGKPEGLSAEFNHRNKAAEVFESRETLRHGDNLDRLLFRKQYPRITDCDWLVTIDHDIYINDQEYFLQLIAENCTPENLARLAIIACENHWSGPESNYIRYFLTTPLLMLNLQRQWDDSTSWNIVLTEESDDPAAPPQRYYDTGQLLAERLGKERIKTFSEFPDHVLHHFYSEWQWMSDPEFKKQEYEHYMASISRTKNLLRDGFFVPSRREIPLMRQYAYFRDTLDQLQGFEI